MFEPLEDRRVLSATLAGFDAHTLPRVDDSIPSQFDNHAALGFAINFYGKQYDHVYVNNNGHLTFNSALSAYTPFALTTALGTPIIAPYFADVDTRPTPGGNVTYGTGTVDGHLAFAATWHLVGYYNQHLDKLNTFQVVIVDRPDLGHNSLGDDFQIELNYDQIQWDTGDVNRSSHQSAVAGFASGTGDPGTFVQLVGSGVTNGFLDSNSATGLIHQQANSGVPGRYVFTIQGGQFNGTSTAGSTQGLDEGITIGQPRLPASPPVSPPQPIAPQSTVTIVATAINPVYLLPAMIGLQDGIAAAPTSARVPAKESSALTPSAISSKYDVHPTTSVNVEHQQIALMSYLADNDQRPLLGMEPGDELGRSGNKFTPLKDARPLTPLEPVAGNLFADLWWVLAVPPCLIIGRRMSRYARRRSGACTRKLLELLVLAWPIGLPGLPTLQPRVHGTD